MILFIDKKFFLSIIIVTALFFIKLQNFMLMIVFLSICLIFTKGTFFYRIRLLLIPVFIIPIILYAEEIFYRLDYFRFAMFLEDGGNPEVYIEIGSVFNFLKMGIGSGFNFLLKPYPWEAQILLQEIQSFENIVVLLFILNVIFKNWSLDKFMVSKWIILFAIGLVIYGLVVFNFGTSARYRFPFVTLFIVGLYYDLFKRYGPKVFLKY